MPPLHSMSEGRGSIGALLWAFPLHQVNAQIFAVCWLRRANQLETPPPAVEGWHFGTEDEYYPLLATLYIRGTLSGWWKITEETHHLGGDYYCCWLYILPGNIQFPGLWCTGGCTGMTEDRVFGPCSCNQLDLMAQIFFSLQAKELSGARISSSYTD